MDSPSPRFTDPEPYGFLYLGFQAEPAQRSPLHAPTPRRRRLAARLVEAVPALVDRPDVVSVRVLRAVFIAPLPGAPRYDLAMLVRTAGVGDLDTVRTCDELSSLGGEQVLAGVNVARIGDTDARGDGTFLVNHFTAPPGTDAEGVWRSVTGWYTTKTGVDNSTALRPVGASPFALVNYARLPTGPVRFLAGQLARPSFHRVVRATLDAHGMRALPAFHRHVHASA
ncbi:hypothetical protein [Micromonospora maritima]|uniref:hypothetical protein n=1 Tax=Micromonospora maritima TaxID=986711 RepID=UPI00157DE42B|nr:hypothetical protein [Micromonospora maritima]